MIPNLPLECVCSQGEEETLESGDDVDNGI